MFFITISRQTGSSGNDIAKLLSQRLGSELIDHQYVMDNWLCEVADKHELHMLNESSKFYNRPCSKGITFADYIENRLKDTVNNNSVIILGLGAQIIFRNNPAAVHIRIISSDKTRKKRLMDKYGLDRNQAEKTIELSDRKHRRYVWRIYGEDWSDPSFYHLCLNTDGLGVNEAADLIIHLMDLKKRSPSSLGQPDTPAVEKNKDARTFNHPSEQEFAGILEMHQIKWCYEPTEFPLEWDAEGNITMGFRPDFYLPTFDTYIELTTMKQKYVTEKNKKIRKLKKIYPDINIRIVYKKDYHNLLKKFNIQEGD